MECEPLLKLPGYAHAIINGGPERVPPAAKKPRWRLSTTGSLQRQHRTTPVGRRSTRSRREVDWGWTSSWASEFQRDEGSHDEHAYARCWTPSRRHPWKSTFGLDNPSQQTNIISIRHNSKKNATTQWPQWLSTEVPRNPRVLWRFLDVFRRRTVKSKK